MNNKGMNLALILTGVLGAGMFVYSLMQQTSLQSRMNETMAFIDHSIVATGAKVEETSEALQPLADTTEALVKIGQREEQTVTALNSMNAHLSVTADHERRIIKGLESLNATTSGVSAQLTEMDQLIATMLGVSGKSVTQANQEEQSVTSLNAMTQTSVEELKTLNEKLAPLRMLP